jgi:CubicO group peptidase (beta-lactamase class C family)
VRNLSEPRDASRSLRRNNCALGSLPFRALRQRHHDRHLYPPHKLCYKPNIEPTKPLPATRTPASFPAAAHQQQDAVFASAFALLRQAIADHAFPAASIAITHHGLLVALKAFGRFTYESESPETTTATIFDLASVTKVVATTSMAMILYQRGLLDLDLPVVAVVAEFAGDDPRRDAVTLRMLLAHSSGLPAYEKLFLHAKTRDELISAAFATPLAADPGAVAAYSDIGFIILGVALERIAEESLNRCCQHEVFGPLAMTHTAFSPPSAWKASIPPTANDQTFRRRIIQGEVQDENASVMGGVAGHAGLFATAGDLAIFAHAMLAGGQPILRPETLALFTRREPSPAGTSRALGWDTPSSPSQSGKYFSAASFGHLGYTGTSLWIDPERLLSVTLLTNRTWPDCSNQAIKQLRPKLHDAVIESLGGA